MPNFVSVACQASDEDLSAVRYRLEFGLRCAANRHLAGRQGRTAEIDKTSSFQDQLPILGRWCIAAAARCLEGMRRFTETKPAHGECGGYMVLGQSLTEQAGHAHRMAGLLDVSFSFGKRKLQLGYRPARLAEAHPLGQHTVNT